MRAITIAASRPGSNLLHTFAAQGAHPPVLMDHAWTVSNGAGQPFQNK